MTHKRRLVLAVILGVATTALFSLGGCSGPPNETQTVSSALRAKALGKLRDVVRAQQRWVKVHAAESLLQLGYADEVVAEFQDELAAHGDEPEYRIGIWRVLARAAQYQGGQEEWLDKIEQAFFDEDSPDRVHAAETLAKLRVPIPAEKLDAVVRAADGQDARLAAYSRWWLAVSGDPEKREEDRQQLWDLLGSQDATARRIAAYAVRFLGEADPGPWNRLVELSEVETDPAMKVRLLATAWIIAPASVGDEQVAAIRQRLLHAATPQAPRCKSSSAKRWPNERSRPTCGSSPTIWTTADPPPRRTMPQQLPTPTSAPRRPAPSSASIAGDGSLRTRSIGLLSRSTRRE